MFTIFCSLFPILWFYLNRKGTLYSVHLAQWKIKINSQNIFKVLTNLDNLGVLLIKNLKGLSLILRTFLPKFFFWGGGVVNFSNAT